MTLLIARESDLDQNGACNRSPHMQKTIWSSQWCTMIPSNRSVAAANIVCSISFPDELRDSPSILLPKNVQQDEGFDCIVPFSCFLNFLERSLGVLDEEQWCLGYSEEVAG